MIYFIESSFPAYLTNHIENGIFIYTFDSYKFAPPNQNSYVINSIFLFKLLKIVSALFQINCTFQGGGGLAYKLAIKKSVISDGILTELLVDRKYIQPNTFISLKDIPPSTEVTVGKKIILGNNFFEFGNISYSNYEKYLRKINTLFPDALYFPHPKENTNLPQLIFSNRVICFSGNIEEYCKLEGIPENIISFLGSTAVASLALMANSNIKIDALLLDKGDYDGPLGNVTDPVLFNKKGIEVTAQLLENIVFEILKKRSSITLSKHSIKL
jgi:hypothetical protein